MSSSNSFSSAGSNSTDNLKDWFRWQGIVTSKIFLFLNNKIKNLTTTVDLLLGSMRYVSGLMRSMVTPRSGSVRSSCLCCFSRDVALYCTNLQQKNKCQAMPSFTSEFSMDAEFTCADQMDMWWIWGQRGCQASCCSTLPDRPLLTYKSRGQKHLWLENDLCTPSV